MIARIDTHRRLTFYVIPVLIGLGGVVYSQQLDDLFWRAVALIISISLPLYAGGNLLARFRTSNLERLAMLSGVLMLILGAAFSVSGLYDSLAQTQYVHESVISASRVIGMLSLFLGLFVVLFNVVRTGENIDEYAERFRFLAEHISEGFILSTPDGIIILVNQKALDMFGMERAAVIGHNARELALSFGFSTIASQLENRAEGVASEYEVLWRAGGKNRVLLINGAPVFNKQGRHTLTMATVRDITEHRHLTERVEQYARDLQQLVEEQTHKLHQSEERLRKLLISMNEGFLTIDRAHRIRFANARAAAILKLDEESLLNREIFEVVDSIGRPRLLNLFSRAMADTPGKGLHQEIEFINGLGNPVPAVVGVAYLDDSEAEGRGYSLVITPIADLKRMQQQLLLRARELERVNEELRLHDRAKDGFLSNVSHELRTPLATIQGYIEMLLGKDLGEIGEQQHHALKVMERNAEHLLTHINEMIEFSRMQIRGIQVVPNLFDACVLAREALAAIHPAAAEKAIAAVVEIDLPCLYAWGDREKLSQVLGILLNNAVKFTEQGGNILLRAAPHGETGVVFSVHDTGIGVAPEFQDKIFSRFFQVDSSKTRQYEGAGIGLSIAQNIVQAHGGTLAVDSDLGKGSTFTVVLPDSVFHGWVKSEAASGMEGRKILIVEESLERRAALTSFAPMNQCTVWFAPNGFQVMRQLADETPDLIIINDAPADVAGETTLRILRQRPDMAAVPALILTSESGDIIKRAVDMQALVRFLFRPFTAEVLVLRMRQICMSGPDALEHEAAEELHQMNREWPFVIIVDADPGFLEWVEIALRQHDVNSQCAAMPRDALSAGKSRKPDAIFLDGDVPPPMLREMLGLFNCDAQTRHAPVYIMTGMDDVRLPDGANAIAGVLRKPFPISDMTDMIARKV